MKLSSEKQGELFIFSEAILWGLFPVVSIISYKSLSPLSSLAWSILFATLFFSVIMTIQKKWKELLTPHIWKDILLISFFIGICFYGFFFWGMKYTSAGNASIVALIEIFFSYLLFHVWKKDGITLPHILGALLMIIGAFLVLFPGSFHLNKGDILILIAVLFAPLGNHSQQRVRKKISSISILFLRSLFSAPIIFLLAYLLGESNSLAEARHSLMAIVINGVTIMGFSKILWLEGIHRISVVKALALGSISPIFALIFSYFIFDQIPSIWQISAFIPIFFGILLLTRTSKKKDVVVES